MMMMIAVELKPNNHSNDTSSLDSFAGRVPQNCSRQVKGSPRPDLVFGFRLPTGGSPICEKVIKTNGVLLDPGQICEHFIQTNGFFISIF